MAHDDSQERTEDASEKRLKEGKEKGQITRSKELNMAAVLIIGSFYLFFLSEPVVEDMINIFKYCFDLERKTIYDINLLTEHIYNAIVISSFSMLPFLFLMIFVSIFFPLLVGGWNFSFESFEPKLERLDPINGLKKIFSMKTVIELIKSVLKFVLLVGVGLLVVKTNLADIFLLDDKYVTSGIVASVIILGKGVILLTTSLLLIVMIDIPYQIWEHMKQMKMTKQEVRDEGKETEGRPEVRSKIRSMQRELSRRRMMSEVPKADVVITNPSHFAVALKYDQNGAGAPIVVAKGVDLIAEMIKKVAIANAVTIVPMPPLARSLYYHVELEEEIPRGLYVGVAKILAYVYELKQYKAYKSTKPSFPKDIEIPDEYKK